MRVAAAIFCSCPAHIDASAPVPVFCSSWSIFAAFSVSVTALPAPSATVKEPLFTACTHDASSTNVANAQLLQSPGLRRTVTDNTFPKTLSASVTAAGSSAQSSGTPPTQTVVLEPGAISASSSTTALPHGCAHHNAVQLCFSSARHSAETSVTVILAPLIGSPARQLASTEPRDCSTKRRNTNSSVMTNMRRHNPLHNR